MKPNPKTDEKKGMSIWIPVLLLMFGLFFTMNSMLNGNVPYGIVGIAIVFVGFYFTYRYFKSK